MRKLNQAEILRIALLNIVMPKKDKLDLSSIEQWQVLEDGESVVCTACNEELGASHVVLYLPSLIWDRVIFCDRCIQRISKVLMSARCFTCKRIFTSIMQKYPKDKQCTAVNCENCATAEHPEAFNQLKELRRKAGILNE